MRVATIMIIETEDYGEKEFRKGIEKLINDIDTKSKLIEFEMFSVPKHRKLKDYIHNQEW